MIVLFRCGDAARQKQGSLNNCSWLSGPSHLRATNIRHMNEDEKKPAADTDAPRGMSDEVLEGDTLDLADDPAKEEKKPDEEKRR